jgi:hypothetical protein
MDSQFLSVQERKKRLCNIGKCCEKPSSLKSREYAKGIENLNRKFTQFLGGVAVRYQADDEKSAIIEVKSMNSANGASSTATFGVSRSAAGSITAPTRRKPKRRPPKHFDDSALNSSTCVFIQFFCSREYF